MEQINSIKDERIIEARQLNKPTSRENFFLLEGENIIQWALDAQIMIKHVFVSTYYVNESILNLLIKKNIPVYGCSDGIMKKINESKYLIPIIGVAIIPKKSSLGHPDMILMLDGLQDQGNIGTIIRTSCAFGINDIITTERNADIYNKKTIIASRGAVFRIKCESSNNGLDTIKRLQNKGYQIVSTSPHGNRLQSLLDLGNRPVVLIVGNETDGISDKILQQSDVIVQIPMHKEIESLNVGVATGISLYEFKLKVLIAMLVKNIRKTLGRKVGVAHKLIQAVLDYELEKVCTYTSQQIILLMIMACDEIISLKQIEKDMACYGQELDIFLQPLLKEKLIEQNGKNYSVTSKGEELLAKLWDVEKGVEEKVFSGFTSEEQELFKRFIDRINQNCEDIIKK